MYWPAEPQVWKGHRHPSTPAITNVICRTQASSALMKHLQPSPQAGSTVAGLLLLLLLSGTSIFSGKVPIQLKNQESLPEAQHIFHCDVFVTLAV